jgi:hypothetical protein
LEKQFIGQPLGKPASVNSPFNPVNPVDLWLSTSSTPSSTSSSSFLSSTTSTASSSSSSASSFNSVDLGVNNSDQLKLNKQPNNSPSLFTTASFAQTKFGSTKSKNYVKVKQQKMLPNEFSAYIKQKSQLSNNTGGSTSPSLSNSGGLMGDSSLGMFYNNANLNNLHSIAMNSDELSLQNRIG